MPYAVIVNLFSGHQRVVSLNYKQRIVTVFHWVGDAPENKYILNEDEILCRTSPEIVFAKLSHLEPMTKESIALAIKADEEAQAREKEIQSATETNFVKQTVPYQLVL